MTPLASLAKFQSPVAPAVPLLGGQAPMMSGFNFLDPNVGLQGVLGGVGREGGGLIGAGLGALFGSGPNNMINLGGGNMFTPGVGFEQLAQGPVMPGGSAPTASGMNLGSFFGSLFG